MTLYVRDRHGRLKPVEQLDDLLDDTGARVRFRSDEFDRVYFNPIEVDKRHLSYAYICHWKRDVFGIVKYRLPEFLTRGLE